MQVALRQDAADFNDFLAFVDDFAVGGCADPGASNPKESPFLDGLEELFRETSPQQKPIETTASCIDISMEANSLNAEKSLVLTAAPVTKAAKKTSGRPRVSRKEELEYLRLKVKEMESKLHQLKEKSDGSSPPPTAPLPPSNQPKSMQVENSIALWKTMAGRQKTQRELVEVENVKLREKLKTQVRMAKSLKRILCKRTRDEDQVSNTPKRTRPLLDGLSNAAGVFDEMLRCLDELYVETDKHVALCPTASMERPVLRKRDVKANDTAGMFLEFKDSKLWPFGLQTVSKATWRFLKETGRKFSNYIEEHVEMRDNTMLRKFGVEFKHGNSVAVLFGRQVTRRYVGSDRVVLVRHSVIDEIQLPGRQTSGLTFRESGWIVLSNAPSLGIGRATVTQAYSTMTPDIDLNSQWEVGTLTDFVLQSREDAEAGNETIIESLLLEEAAKQTATS